MLTDGLKKIFSLCRSLVCRSYQISLSRCVTSSVICRKVEHVSPRELLYEMLLFPRSKGNLPRAPPATEDPGAWPRALLCWAVAAPRARQREIPEMRKGRGGSERGREICRKPTSFCTECQPGPKGLLVQGQEVLGCWGASSREDVEQKEGPSLFKNTVAMALSPSNGIFLATCYFCFSLFAFQLGFKGGLGRLDLTC